MPERGEQSREDDHTDTVLQRDHDGLIMDSSDESTTEGEMYYIISSDTDEDEALSSSHDKDEDTVPATASVASAGPSTSTSTTKLVGRPKKSNI